MRLAGKVAIVTGGGKGIGRAYVRGLAAEGAKVVAADIDETATVNAQREIEDKGGEALAVTVDVSDDASINRMVQQTIDRFGRVDVLVNNAALFAALPRHKWDEIPLEEWDKVMSVNVRGVYLCSKAVVPHMCSQGGGSIINIASAIFLSPGGGGLIHYIASKAAVMGLTRALCRELGEFGIRVNSIGPGLTASEEIVKKTDPAQIESRSVMGSIKRVETPEDLVGTVLFLASDDSAFITGQMLVVDGGRVFH